MQKRSKKKQKRERNYKASENMGKYRIGERIIMRSPRLPWGGYAECLIVRPFLLVGRRSEAGEYCGETGEDYGAGVANMCRLVLLNVRT